jgi:hypothetical protein
VLRGAPAGIVGSVWPCVRRGGIDDLADSISFLSIILTEKISSTSLSETRLAVRRDRARAGVCEDLRLGEDESYFSARTSTQSPRKHTPPGFRIQRFSSNKLWGACVRAAGARAHSATPISLRSVDWPRA